MKLANAEEIIKDLGSWIAGQDLGFDEKNALNNAIRTVNDHTLSPAELAPLGLAVLGLVEELKQEIELEIEKADTEESAGMLYWVHGRIQKLQHQHSAKLAEYERMVEKVDAWDAVEGSLDGFPFDELRKRKIEMAIKVIETIVEQIGRLNKARAEEREEGEKKE